jgi:hypothetical protein
MKAAHNCTYQPQCEINVWLWLCTGASTEQQALSPLLLWQQPAAAPNITQAYTCTLNEQYTMMQAHPNEQQQCHYYFVIDRS